MLKKFPLWKNDGKPAEYFKNKNRDSVSKLIKAIKNNELRLVENNCLCNNDHADADVVIAEKDRFGLPIPQVLCSKCGLIRSGLVFDEKSNNLFYEKYYRSVYNDNQNTYLYFQYQIKRGTTFVELLKNNNLFESVEDVAELGCGAGGVLYPFFLNGKIIKGVDFDKDYLKLGVSHGLDLKYGDFYEIISDNSCDIVILSHVFEHFVNPIDAIVRVIPKIRLGKYMIMEVPGLYWDANWFNPILFFQNAHVIQYFYKEWLDLFFSKLGLKVIYGDERCTFICQKVSNEIPDVRFIYDEILSEYPKKNAEYLLECKKRYEDGLKLDRRNRLRGKLRNIAYHLGWKKIKPYIGKWIIK